MCSGEEIDGEAEEFRYFEMRAHACSTFLVLFESYAEFITVDESEWRRGVLSRARVE